VVVSRFLGSFVSSPIVLGVIVVDYRLHVFVVLVAVLIVSVY